MGTTTFTKATPSTAISYFEHKMTYIDKVADAENEMLSHAGRGKISVLIVGRSHAAVLRGLPGFTLVSDGNTLGAHVFGTYEGITIIRVPETTLMPANNGVGIWKGLSPFEAAAVYAPFMPLVVTGVLPEAPNPFVSMRGAGVWAGVDTLVPSFATNFNIV